MRESRAIDSLQLLGLGGANKVMAGELSRLARRLLSRERANEVLGRPPRKTGPGGLAYPYAVDLAALAVTYHRTSARVLWGLYESSARRLEPLYEQLVELVKSDDREWLKPGLGISVVEFHATRIEAGSRQVVGVVKNALIDGAARRGVGLRVEPDHPDLIFHVRTGQNESGQPVTTVSIDLAGRPMHRRGYRNRPTEAPLREDLAANLVMLSRFDGRKDVLIDPLAGSGTLAVEAALMAAGRAVWMSGRKPLAHTLPEMSQALEALGAPVFGDCVPDIFAGEMDDGAYDALRANLQTAGTSRQTTTCHGDFRDWDLAEQLQGQESGVILSNPPYGGRLQSSKQELARLYDDLGQWCRQFAGFRAAFIVGQESSESVHASPVQLFERAFGGRPRVKKPLSNGRLRAQFFLYDL